MDLPKSPRVTSLSVLFALTAITSAAAEPGAVVLIGGVLRYDNQAVWERIIELAGGQGAKFAVFPTATGRPKLYGRFAVQALHKYGASAELIPVSPKTRDIGVDYRQAVRDETLLDKVRNADGIFFTGGAPQYIARTLYSADGTASPMLAAIWEMHARGGVVAGANAGHTVLSTDTRAAAALHAGLTEQATQRGLGLLSDDWFIDQHYFSHGRFAASLVAMRELAIKQGVGVGVNTAIAITGSRQAEVIGTGGVMVIDLSQTRFNESGQAFSLTQGKLSYLGNGDQFNPATLQITPHDSKLQGFEVGPNVPDPQPRFEKAFFYTDIFVHSALPRLIFSAIDSKQQQGVGLVYTERSAGFKFHFYAGRDSIGWLGNANDYTAANVYLDVTPVKPGQDFCLGISWHCMGEPSVN